MSGVTMAANNPVGGCSPGGSVVQSGAMGAVELCETGGRALKLQTDTPHLVSLGGGRLSTAVTLHPIPQGRVTLGSGIGVDIPVHGTGVQASHCYIENNNGIVTLYPIAEHISIDGTRVAAPMRLTQGVMLTIGRSNYMKFNHPAEAKLMKSVLSNSRLSMAPMTFESQDAYLSKFNKKPPVAPRRSPRESFAETGLEESSNCIMSKVSKFEYLAAQNALKNVSPKVFSANSVTVNTPAKDVLGKAPPNLKNFAKNLPQSAINYSDSVNYNDKKNKTPDRQVFGRKSPSQYVNVTLNDTSPKNTNNRVIIHENGCIPKHQNAYVNVSIEAEMNNLNNRNFAGSNQSLKNIGVNNFGNRMVATPSPSFNRNPSPYFRSITPSPVSPQVQQLENRSGSVGELRSGKSASGSIEDLTHRKHEAEHKRNQAYAERVKEQEEEKVEQARLEEILSMCAEYEKQAQWEKNNKPIPNRIKTNGSLPRDKRQCPSPAQLPDEQIFQFDSSSTSHKDKNQSSNSKSWHIKNNRNNQYENVIITQLNQVAVISSKAEQERNRLDYENVELASFDCGSPYENVMLMTPPNTSSPFPQSPRTKIKTTCNSPNKQTTPKELNETPDPKFSFNVTADDQSENRSFSPQFSIDSQSADFNKETPKLKLNAQKFILPIEVENNISVVENTKEKIEKNRIERLKGEKKEIMSIMVTIKRNVSDIEIQEEELLRELEMEKALLNGERQSKLLELEEDEKLKEKLSTRAKQIDIKMEECRITQTQYQEDCKKKLEHALCSVERLECELSKISKASSTYPDLVEELVFAREHLDNEKKAFEDVEFHHLEEEADWLASREEIQREILDLSQMIETKKSSIIELETQKTTTLDNTSQESTTLERQLLIHLRKLEDCRTRLAVIESELQEYSDKESENDLSSDSENEKQKKFDNFTILKDSIRHEAMNSSCYNMTQSYNEKLSMKLVDDVFNMSQSFNEKLLHEKTILDFNNTNSVGTKCPSQDDIDRISKVTSNAPINIEDGRGSLGRKTIESLKEIERNRQLHLAQQGSQVIEQERRRVLALKQRAQDEVRTQWAQNRHKDCTSLNSTGSDETQLDSVSGSDDPDKRNSSTTTGNEPSLQQELLKMRPDSDSPDSPRPMSESSELSCDTGISADAVLITGNTVGTNGSSTLNRRPKRYVDKHRPLTRYLPIRNAELDLRKHIETAGHQVELCPHVTITTTTCKGFLHKMGSKLHGWSRRWFVFDRNNRTLVYYSDKNEKKVRGGAYFQAIEEVYLDHQNTIKSPNPHLTFIVKTHERSYHLMAPSAEAMRIWVDVIFTGAEGYQEFEHGT